MAACRLKLNTKKTEVTSSIEGGDAVFDANIAVFMQAKVFLHMVGYLSAEGVDAAVRGRIKCAWLKWKESTGILCNRRCSTV
ncbi:hypothetical protein Y032_0123g1128 [Ancylostoma ceylanicum]|uniref:Uncharacterized protein n=1 Tax=Ancylostoma ceylanicum TaxID=53326 RepID=A0A016T8J2_9BILA|nr:hypothetical protein Y032_0123g1128 [Ancylostoma ceylanicum]